jgi:hypothetical protein
MKSFVSLIIVYFLLLLASAVFAQESIKGIVKDDVGDPVPGATVLIKGSSNYTVTDTKGEFVIASDHLMDNKKGWEGNFQTGSQKVTYFYRKQIAWQHCRNVITML